MHRERSGMKKPSSAESSPSPDAYRPHYPTSFDRSRTRRSTGSSSFSSSSLASSSASSSSSSSLGKPELYDPSRKCNVVGSKYEWKIVCSEGKRTVDDCEEPAAPSDGNSEFDHEGKASVVCGEKNNSVCASSAEDGQCSTSASGSGIERAEWDLMRHRLDSLHTAESEVDHGLREVPRESNKQEQQDEILALQAIFEEGFITLEGNDSSTQAFMLSIHVPSTSLAVLLKLPDESDRASSDKFNHSAGSKIWACSVEFLPPIYLMYRMPISYPSNSQPSFVLSACWLSNAALAKLCQGLDMLWKDQVGNVVIYSWAEWLQTTCLSYLGIANELELDFGHNSKTCDDRVVSYRTSPDRLIQFLIRYNEDKKSDIFLNSIHTCYICFSDVLGKEFIKLPCKHFFCVGCTKQYVTMNVKEGTVKRLKCMDSTCKDSIPPSVLKQLLSDVEFARWENLLLQKTLDSMTDVVYCPRCEVVCIEDDDHFAQCVRCLFSFCSLCRGPRHVGQECLTAEARLQILKERQERSSSGADTKKKEQDFLNELMNLKYVQEKTKQCPACKMAITKFEGCNKITCGNCGQYFCYRCNKAIEGYDHFREGCVLFDDEEIQRWERAMHVGNNARPDVRVGLTFRSCPSCRQENIKEGNNNHIFCWSCQRHFCALCRKIVRRSSDHYGPNKCKQHTAD